MYSPWYMVSRHWDYFQLPGCKLTNMAVSMKGTLVFILLGTVTESAKVFRKSIDHICQNKPRCVFIRDSLTILKDLKKHVLW